MTETNTTKLERKTHRVWIGCEERIPMNTRDHPYKHEELPPEARIYCSKKCAMENEVSVKIRYVEILEQCEWCGEEIGK